MIGAVTGAFIGNSAARKDAERSSAAMEAALAAIQGVYVPTVEEQKIILDQLESSGQLTPELESALTLGPSEMQKANVDPRLKEAQMTALEQLQGLGKSGFGAQEQADMAALQNQVSRDANARNDTMLQNLAQRGVAGGGMELAARLSTNQSADASEAQRAREMMAAANARSLDAISRSGQLGSQMGDQEFQQKSAKAQAMDAINQFNLSNQQNIGQRNIGSKNSAQAANLTNAQNISNQNVGLRNEQEMKNKALYQGKFNNEMIKAQGIAGVQAGLSQMYGDKAQATRNMWAGIGQGADKTAGSIIGMIAGGPAGSKAGGDIGGAGGDAMNNANGVGSASANGQQANKGFAHGGYVHGDAIVPGDSSMNDIVDANLSAGEVVVPKSVVKTPSKADEFVAKAVKKEKKDDGMFDVESYLDHLSGYKKEPDPKEILANLHMRMRKLEG